MFGTRQPVSKTVFDKFDTDRSGSIDASELRELCHSLGHHLSAEELALALVKMDSSGDHSIAYTEFAEWWSQGERRWQKVELTGEEAEKLTQAVAYFDYFDTDKSGSVSEEEFVQLHQNLVENGMLTAAQSDSFADMDKTGEGGVDFNEYVDWLASKGVFK